MNKKIIGLLGAVVVSAASLGGWIYLKSKGPKFTDPTLQKITERGTLIVGTDATYPPMESVNNSGQIVGLDVEIAKEIAKDLGVEVDMRNIAWDKLCCDTTSQPALATGAVQDGEVDMAISSVTITPERAEVLGFSDPYFNAGQVIIVKKGDQEIQGPEDLEGKKVGVQTGTTSETEAKKYKAVIVPYADYTTAPADIKAGKIKATIIDYPAAKGIVNKNADLEIVGEPFTQEFYGVVVRKTEAALLEQINETIRRLKQEGKLKQLEDVWL